MVPGECRGCKAGLSTVSVRGVLKHWWPDDNGELEDCADSGLKEPKKVLLEEACALL